MLGRAAVQEHDFVERCLMTANGAKVAGAAGYSANRRGSGRCAPQTTSRGDHDHRGAARAERVGINSNRVLAEFEQLAFGLGKHQCLFCDQTEDPRPVAPASIIAARDCRRDCALNRTEPPSRSMARRPPSVMRTWCRV